MTLRVAAAAVLDLVLPTACPGCREPAAGLCRACLPALSDAVGPRRPTPCPAGLPPLAAAADYAGVARRTVLAFKEQRRRTLVEPLASALAAAVEAALDALGYAGGAGSPAGGGVAAQGPLLLVPVPCSAPARRARGFDHTEALARRAAHRLRQRGVPTRVVPALRHVRTVADSAGLDSAARAANLAGAFSARTSLLCQPGRLVLVDDVATTGATLAEAARAASAAGRPAYAAAVVAATRRRHPA